MTVVSNTSPLSELAKIGRLTILREVHGLVVIPTEVWEEVTAGAHPAIDQVRAAAWIRTRNVADGRSLSRLRDETGLGLGECAAVVLALEMGADLLLIDDRAARKAAEARGLRIAGTVATLVFAKRRGIVPAVRPLLDELIAHGTRIGRSPYTDAVEFAGE